MNYEKWNVFAEWLLDYCSGISCYSCGVTEAEHARIIEKIKSAGIPLAKLGNVIKENNPYPKHYARCGGPEIILAYIEAATTHKFIVSQKVRFRINGWVEIAKKDQEFDEKVSKARLELSPIVKNFSKKLLKKNPDARLIQDHLVRLLAEGLK